MATLILRFGLTITRGSELQDFVKVCWWPCWGYLLDRAVLVPHSLVFGLLCHLLLLCGISKVLPSFALCAPAVEPAAPHNLVLLLSSYGVECGSLFVPDGLFDYKLLD